MKTFREICDLVLIVCATVVALIMIFNKEPSSHQIGGLLAIATMVATNILIEVKNILTVLKEQGLALNDLKIKQMNSKKYIRSRLIILFLMFH